MVPEERYNVRVKFSKVGSLKFISHLDLARTMRSAFLRAKLPIWYTLGFNPHPKMVFSLPLSVGTASKCEFMDFMLTEKLPYDEVVSRLNAAFPAELRAIEAYEPTTRFCDIKNAEYLITIGSPRVSPDVAREIPKLFEGEVLITKTTKAGTKEIDISPLCSIVSSEYKDGEIDVCAVLSCGENSFVNPKYVIEHIVSKYPDLLDGGDYSVCREKVFADGGETEFR